MKAQEALDKGFHSQISTLEGSLAEMEAGAYRSRGIKPQVMGLPVTLR